MQKGQEEHWNKEGIKDARRLHDEAYFARISSWQI